MFVNEAGLIVPTVPIIDTRKPNGTDIVTGLTDLYAVRLGLDESMLQLLLVIR